MQELAGYRPPAPKLDEVADLLWDLEVADEDLLTSTNLASLADSTNWSRAIFRLCLKARVHATKHFHLHFGRFDHVPPGALLFHDMLARE